MISRVRQAGVSNHAIDRWVDRIDRPKRDLVKALRTAVWAGRGTRRRVIAWLRRSSPGRWYDAEQDIILVNRDAGAAFLVKQDRAGTFVVVTVVALVDVESPATQGTG